MFDGIHSLVFGECNNVKTQDSVKLPIILNPQTLLDRCVQSPPHSASTDYIQHLSLKIKPTRSLDVKPSNLIRPGSKYLYNHKSLAFGNFSILIQI